MRYSETRNGNLDVGDGVKLPIYCWLPDKSPKAIFIAIHGGMAHGGDWAIPALYFKERGIATYSLDLRYHGHYPELNPGSNNIFHIDSYDTYAKDIEKFNDYVKKENPNTPIFILSHSNGGLISLYYGLKYGKDKNIKGLAISSPWLKNRVKVPFYISLSAKLLALINPTMAISPAPLTDVLTHDENITESHYKFEDEGIRGTTASPKLSVEFPKAQKYVLSNIASWNLCPVFGIIAGEDHLADPICSIEALRSIKNHPRKIELYPENYHENFNELNRVEIFDKVLIWMNQYL